MDLQLFVDLADMGVDGINAAVHFPGDFLVKQPRGKQFQYLAFPR